MMLCLALTLALAACAEDGAIRLLDAEGPRGTVPPPGPWGIAVLTDGAAPRVWWAVGEGGFVELALDAAGDGQFVGRLPPAGAGTTFAWYAELGPERLPPGGAEAPYRFAVVDPTEVDAGPPSTCRLVFTRPLDGQRITEADDDNAPQAGIQLTVRVGADLPPGHAVRLTVGDASYAGRIGVGEAEPGEVAFAGVTLGGGSQTLIADAVAPGGAPCSAEVVVQGVLGR